LFYGLLLKEHIQEDTFFINYCLTENFQATGYFRKENFCVGKQFPYQI